MLVQQIGAFTRSDRGGGEQSEATRYVILQPTQEGQGGVASLPLLVSS